MKIKEPKFVTSAYSSKDYPEHNLLEFAFVGRSNVGKSSLINKLVNRKKLARTSSEPGRTQSINFYDIDGMFFLVDLPGYGFARVPKKLKEEWGNLINDYLVNRPHLTGIIQIVDARHKPTSDDKVMFDWLKEAGISVLLVATKVDKISRGQRKKQERLIKETLGLKPNLDIEFVFFSAKSGEGKNKIISFIKDNIDQN